MFKHRIKILSVCLNVELYYFVFAVFNFYILLFPE